MGVVKKLIIMYEKCMWTLKNGGAVAATTISSILEHFIIASMLCVQNAGCAEGLDLTERDRLYAKRRQGSTKNMRNTCTN